MTITYKFQFLYGIILTRDIHFATFDLECYISIPIWNYFNEFVRMSNYKGIVISIPIWNYFNTMYRDVNIGYDLYFNSYMELF